MSEKAKVKNGVAGKQRGRQASQRNFGRLFLSLAPISLAHSLTLSLTRSHSLSLSLPLSLALSLSLYLSRSAAVCLRAERRPSLRQQISFWCSQL